MILVFNDMFLGSGHRVQLVSREIDHPVNGQNGIV